MKSISITRRSVQYARHSLRRSAPRTALKSRTSLEPGTIPPLITTPPPPLASTTSFYNITPLTMTEVAAHDVKAASMTKALYIDSLPPSLPFKRGNTEFHNTFKKAVFETFFFEPLERHPTRTKRDRKPNDIVVNGIFGQVLRFLNSKVDHTKISLQTDYRPYFEHAFERTLPDYQHPQPFLISGHLSYNILSDTPAAPLFTLEQCQGTAEHPVEWPELIRSTLDISTAYHMDTIIPGRNSSHLPSHPHLRIILDTSPGAEWSDTSRARGIYFLFARLANEAIRDGHQPGDTLTTPKTGVFISSSAYSYHFVFYQLNTLDLTSDTGVKNLAWGYSVDNITNKLVPYRKVAPENLLGPEVLEDICDNIKLALLYDLPTKDCVIFE